MVLEVLLWTGLNHTYQTGHKKFTLTVFCQNPKLYLMGYPMVVF